MRRHRSYSLRHLPRSSAFRILLALLLLWDTLRCVSLYTRQIAALNAPPPPRNTKRIYIAAQHWNDARLLRQHWNAALVALLQELGVENVFLSIYESGSYDDSKDALRELDAQLEGLSVKREIVLDDISHADEIARQPSEQGWIKTPDGETRMRRIPFLASVRNHVFAPLDRLTKEGENFDTILFLNDVVFTPRDVLRLLDTNGGKYAAACSLDFSKPPEFYDTFALRDSSGYEGIMQTWPYFRSYVSRYAAERFLPVPVASCWNGMGRHLEQYLHPTLANDRDSCHAHLTLPPYYRYHATPPLPSHTRLPRNQPRRSLRVLPHPRRQPPLRPKRRIPQPKRKSRVQRLFLRRRALIRRHPISSPNLPGGLEEPTAAMVYHNHV
jgi:hypothetical protein